MFFIFLILIVGGSYVYWRFSIISNKKLFFSSPLFHSLAGTISILILSLILVNTLAPSKQQHDPITITFDSTKATIDTSFTAIFNQKDPRFHYQQIVRISYASPEHLSNLEKKYNNLSKKETSIENSIGYFGLGVLSLESKKYDSALNYFFNVTNASLPYLHYCIGKVYSEKEEILLAEEHYLKELDIENGNVNGAVFQLIEQYKNVEDYAKLKKLFDRYSTNELFPHNLARLTLLHERSFGNYILLSVKSIKYKTKLWGFSAALIISFIWFGYLFRLGIFRENKVTYLFLMFVGGCLSILITLLINDLKGLFFLWDLDGFFFNDLLYSIFMIGVPEELAKITPFLLLLALSKKLKEPLEYIVYASASALGFAFIENLLYFQEASHGIIHGRAYLSVIGHMIDSSIVAYCFVLYHFKQKKKTNILILFLITFALGSIAHGLYDFLLFQNSILLFFIFFVFVVQIWIILINNCLNNSSQFAYGKTRQTERTHMYVALALTCIFAAEYLLIGFSKGVEEANYQFYSNIFFASFSIIFFTSNLSSFNLIKGYWRDIYFSRKEKRGYGTLTSRTLLTSWYFVNSIKSHNYVGEHVVLFGDPYNRELREILDNQYEGEIIDRIILSDSNSVDPHWFLLKLNNPLYFNDNPTFYVLIKVRNQSDSLRYDEYIEVFFKSVDNLEQLNKHYLSKDDFPSYGWARVSMKN